MNPANSKSFRTAILLGAALLGIACLTRSARKPTQTPNYIVVTATGDASLPDSSTQGPVQDATSTMTALPDLTATPTVAPVTMTAGQRLSCVKGPHWILYEWVAAIEEGETVTLLARSAPEWPDYYYVRKSDGTECWAYGGSSTVSGDPSTLPLREAPPLPTVTYTIENQTHFYLNEIYIREKSETDWGADRLTTNIYNGSKASLTLTAGFYDVAIYGQFHVILYKAEDIAIGPEASSNYVLINTKVTIQLTNNLAVSVCRIQASPVHGETPFDIYSPSSGPIISGGHVSLTFVTGYYDIRAFRCGDGVLVKTVSSVPLIPEATALILE